MEPDRKQELLDSLKEADPLWDRPSDFLGSEEWQIYRAGLLDRIVACYFEMATLRADKPGFVAEFARLQGSITTLYNELTLFETKDRRLQPEQMKRLDFDRRQGLIARIKEIVKHAIGAG
jgi:hypothetical protein